MRFYNGFHITILVSSRSQYFGSRHHSNLQQIHLWIIFLAVTPKSWTLYSILLKHQKKLSTNSNNTTSSKISSSCSLRKNHKAHRQSYWTGSQKDQTVFWERSLTGNRVSWGWPPRLSIHHSVLLTTVLPLLQRGCEIHSWHALKELTIFYNHDFLWNKRLGINTFYSILTRVASISFNVSAAIWSNQGNVNRATQSKLL